MQRCGPVTVSQAGQRFLSGQDVPVRPLSRPRHPLTRPVRCSWTEQQITATGVKTHAPRSLLLVLAWERERERERERQMRNTLMRSQKKMLIPNYTKTCCQSSRTKIDECVASAAERCIDGEWTNWKRETHTFVS